eukprot:m.253725 g.253725  ORF g.253725 m.253725 type:complete len:342 (+) comp15486_c2_seq6:1424-2449(+)
MAARVVTSLCKWRWPVAVGTGIAYGLKTAGDSTAAAVTGYLKEIQFDQYQEKKAADEQTAKMRSLQYAQSKMTARCKQLVSHYPLNPPNTYVPNSKLENAIKYSLLCFQTGGVLVVHAPQGAGKSAALREVVRKLQEDNRFDAILLNTGQIPMANGLRTGLISALQKECEVPDDSKATWLSDFFQLPSDHRPRNLVIIDQFDDDIIEKKHSASDLKGFITSLATTAQANKLIVVVAVSAPAYSRIILACNNHAKIRSLWGGEAQAISAGEKFAWSEEDLLQVLCKHYQEDIEFHELIDGQAMSEKVDKDILLQKIVRDSKRPRVNDVLEAKNDYILKHVSK